ncbi:hypothetical protein NKH70_31300 [Mesorhizobium sp. M0991]|uniref:hypothetical protein n=1 Tax=unclassified Mesorhizobium TaxID=325217 RepID=UPI00333AA129
MILSEALDPISRDQEDVAGVFKGLSFAGVTIVTLSEDQKKIDAVEGQHGIACVEGFGRLATILPFRVFGSCPVTASFPSGGRPTVAESPYIPE